MEKIIVNPNLNENDYLMYCIKWDASENILIDISNLVSIDDIMRCTTLALSMPEKNFSLAVLEQLSELNSIPMNILKKIFSIGDRGCCESICMRPDLNNDLRRMCDDLQMDHKNIK